MSHVDNVFLTFGILEDADARMAEVNAWLREHAARQQFGPDLGEIDNAYGGSKGLEAVVFAGAFNYLPEHDFLEHLRTVAWRDPDEVQMIIQRQDDDVFEIVWLMPELDRLARRAGIDRVRGETNEQLRDRIDAMHGRPPRSDDDARRIDEATRRLAEALEGEDIDDWQLREIVEFVARALKGAP